MYKIELFTIVGVGLYKAWLANGASWHVPCGNSQTHIFPTGTRVQFTAGNVYIRTMRVTPL